MASDPTAWWDNEPVLQQAPDAGGVGASAPPAPAAPRRQKRSGSLANLLGIGGQRAPDPAGPVIPEGLVLVHTGWLTKQGAWGKGGVRRCALPCGGHKVKTTPPHPHPPPLFPPLQPPQPGHVVKNWKRRFCRLVINSSTSPRTAQLTYYKTEDLG